MLLNEARVRIKNQKITLAGKGLSHAFSENAHILCKLDRKCAHFHENAQNQVF